MDRPLERPIYTDKIMGFIDKGFVKVITGVRRCGKSEIMKLIKLEALKHTDEDHIIFINFERSEFDHIKTYKELNEYTESRMKDDSKYYLFFDEIQSVKNWERSVNSLRLKNTDICITGSSSKLLSGEFATLLRGRHLVFETGTLSFAEFRNFRKECGLGNDSIEDYITIGGFPVLSVMPFTNEQALQIVTDIHSTIIIKDTVERDQVKNVPLLEKIASFIYDSMGSFVSLRNIANYLKSRDNGTGFEKVSSYVGYLEKAYAIKKVKQYDIRGKRLLDDSSKYYLADHSLQYALIGMKRTNLPGVLENIVHNELVRRGYTVYAGKIGTKEVDFVAEKMNGGEKIYVQVCTELSGEATIEREFSPLEEIKDHHHKYVVTLDRYWREDRNGVAGIHLHDFLLRDTY